MNDSAIMLALVSALQLFNHPLAQEIFLWKKSITLNVFFSWTFSNPWGQRSIDTNLLPIHKNICKKSKWYLEKFFSYISEKLQVQMACLNSKILPSKINFLLNFFGHLMTSEVKDHVYKVEDYLVMISEVFLCKKISKLWV